MIKLFNSKFISVFISLLFLLVLAKMITFIVFWYLPKDGEELVVKKNYQPKYQRADFKNMIKGKKIKTSYVQRVEDTSISITSMLLKGLYGTKSMGYVVVAMKSFPAKTSIIAVGESYKGYRLKSISLDSAKFTKGGTDFILTLKKLQNPSNLISKVSNSNFLLHNNSLSVSHRDIKYYSKNPNQIWRDISIQELKHGKKINGFKITNINPNSRFARLGLKRGDVIIRANNIKLHSYKDALDIYKNIDKLDVVQIVVLRNNKEVELVYEIN